MRGWARVGGIVLLLALAVGCTTTPPEPVPEETPLARASPAEPTAAAAPTQPPPSPTLDATATEAEPTPEYTVRADVVYATAANPDNADQALDIYIPAVPNGAPALIYAHGTNQNKTSGLTLGRVLAKQGFVVFVLDWPALLPSRAARDGGEGFRTQLEAVECALRTVGAEGSAHGAAEGQAAWIGFSAGGAIGNLIALGGMTQAELWEPWAETRGGPPPQFACAAEGEPARVTTLIAAASPALPAWLPDVEEEDAELAELLAGYARPEHNPELAVRFLNGAADSTVPIDVGQAYVAELVQAGLDATLQEVPGGHQVPYDPLMAELEALIP